MRHLSWLVVAATLAGLAAGLWAIGLVGLGEILGVIARLGLGSSLLILASSLVVLGALGAAWSMSMRAGPRRWGLFVWGRAAREAANDLLPFSQLGGLVVGLRTVTGGGIERPRAYAATIVDLLTEMIAQLLLTLVALVLFGALLVSPAAPASLATIAWSGLAGVALIAGALAFLQRPALRFAAPLVGRMIPGGEQVVDAVRAELAAFMATRGAILPPLLWNVAAWLLSVGAAWLILVLLDAPLPFVRVLGIEALIFAIRSSAFVVPGALGVQEAGYALLGPIFGLDRETALALSLVKRARDVGIGLPTLLVWQLLEVRRARYAGSSAQ